MSLRTPLGLADLALACGALLRRDDTKGEKRAQVAKISQLLGLTAIGQIHIPIATARLKAPAIEVLSDLPILAPVAPDHPAPPAETDAAEAEIAEEIGMPPEDELEELEDRPNHPLSELRKRHQASRVWGANPSVSVNPTRHPVRAEPGEIPAATPLPKAIAEAEAWPATLQDRGAARSPESLLRHGVRRAFLRDAAAMQAPSDEVDIVRLVDNVARGRWLRRVPQIERRRVVRAPTFLIDVSESMTPFLDEASELMNLAQAMLGCSPSSMTWTSGPPDLAQSDDTRPCPALTPGHTLVVLSLLGLGSGSSEVKEWEEFARMAHRRGVHLVLLTPAIASHWSRSEERRWWRFVPWMPPGCRHGFSTGEQAEKLAMLLSAVALPDPALLRQARLSCFPRVEPYLESLLIRSRWVTAAYRGRLIMSGRELPALHQKLSDSPALLAEARKWTSLSAEGPAGSAAAGPEALAGSLWLDALSHDRDAAERVDAALAGLIKTLLENPADQSFARFAQSVLERLPATVRKTDLGRLAALLVRSGLQQELDPELLATAAEHQSWLFPHTVAVGLAWNGRKLFLRDRPRSGDAIIKLPDTPRRQFHVDWGDDIGAEWRSFFRGQRHFVVSPRLPARITTLRGQSFSLSQPDETDLWRTLRESEQNGEIIPGEIISTVNFDGRLRGFLVDVGLTAFLPAFHADHALTEDPEASLGQTINVIVIQWERSTREVAVSRTRALQREYLERLRVGQRIEGIVIDVAATGVVVKVGPVTGYIEPRELSWDPADTPAQIVAPQEKLMCTVISVDPGKQQLHLSRRQAVPRVRSADFWEETKNRFPVGSRVRGKVVNFVPQGAVVEIEDGLEGLIRVSELSWTRRIIRPSDALTVGQEVQAMVLGVNPEDQRISLGIRQLEPNPWDEIEQRYPIGRRVKGIVRNLTVFGVFVELEDGINGMVHVSELSWTKKPQRPSDLFTEGEEIEAVVIGSNKGDQKISLSIRQLEPNPWDEIERRYPIGRQVQGVVRNLTAFGAFVELEDGINGLIHISELSWTKRITHLADVLTAGQEVQAMVIGVNKDDERISLSIRQLEPNPWDEIERRFQSGRRVQGIVHQLTAKDAYVTLEEGLDGAIPVSELSWTKIKHPSEVIKVGDKIEAVVCSVEKEEERIQLSVRRLTPNPWDGIEQRYPVGGKVQGIVHRLTGQDVYVTLEAGLDGTIAFPELSWKEVKRPSSVIKAGDEIEVLVMGIDKEEQTIHLSMRRLQPNLWENIEQRYPVGGTVQGVVRRLTPKFAFVALEKGLDVPIPVSELSWKKIKRPSDVLHIGNEIEVLVVGLDKDEQTMDLSVRRLHPNPWVEIERRYPINSKVRGIVSLLSAKFASVTLEKGLEGTIPISELSWGKRIKHPAEVIQEGAEIEVVVMSVNLEEQKIILSVRRLEPNVWEEIERRYPIGRRVRGVVRLFNPQEATVTLEEDLEGIIPVSELLWTKVRHPSSVLTAGAEIEAVVMGIDQLKLKIKLSMRRLTPNPWAEIEQRYPVDRRVKGVVRYLTAKYASVTLERGIDGVLFAAELSWLKRIKRPSDLMKVGEEIEAVVMNVNQGQQTIELSMRRVASNPWTNIEHRYPVGRQVQGLVSLLTANYACVTLEENLEGVIPAVELSWAKKIRRPSDVLKPGAEIEAVVTEVSEEEQKINLSVRRLRNDPWEEIEARFKIGDRVSGQVSQTNSRGVFVALDSEISALVPISELPEDLAAGSKNALQVGQEIEARVIKVGKTERQIGLSMKGIS